MYWLKACPRCDGDLAEDTDIYGRYVICLQCGHELTAVEEAALRGLWRVPAAKTPAVRGLVRVTVRGLVRVK